MQWGSRVTAAASAALLEQNKFDAKSVACSSDDADISDARTRLAWAVLCTQRPPGKWAADKGCRLAVNQRHFLKENVMRNFIYAITLVGLGVLQLAIVIAEFARV
jgi:hypothetical protein